MMFRNKFEQFIKSSPAQEKPAFERHLVAVPTYFAYNPVDGLSSENDDAIGHVLRTTNLLSGQQLVGVLIVKRV